MEKSWHLSIDHNHSTIVSCNATAANVIKGYDTCPASRIFTDSYPENLIALSIVGTDRMPENAYFTAKVAQEEVVKAACVPYTIVRATQFMEFIGGIADFGTDGGTVHIGDGMFQPIAADDVAAILAGIAVAVPLDATIDIAGPDRAPFAGTVGRNLKSVGDARPVATDRDARYYGGVVEELSLVPPGDARIGRVDLEQWLTRAKMA